MVWFWCPFTFSNHLTEEEKIGWFTLIVIWLSVLCSSSSSCLGTVCDCGISWQYSLTFLSRKYFIKQGRMIIRIYHDCEGMIDKIRPEDRRLIPNSDPEGRIFLAHLSLKTSCSIGKTQCGISLSHPRDLLIPST